LGFLNLKNRDTFCNFRGPKKINNLKKILMEENFMGPKMGFKNGKIVDPKKNIFSISKKKELQK
jgi:hypothetical protein